VSTILGLYELERFISICTPSPCEISKAISESLSDYFYELHKGLSRKITALASQAFREPQRLEHLIRTCVLNSDKYFWSDYIVKYIWNPKLDVEVLSQISKEKIKSMISQIPKLLQRFKEFNIGFSNSLDLFSEHFVMRLNWLMKDSEHYTNAMIEFVRRYRDEAYEYAILLISAILILRILRRRIPLCFIGEKDLERKALIMKKFMQIVDELDIYTVTFHLLKEPLKQEDSQSVGEADSLEKFRKVLNLE